MLVLTLFVIVFGAFPVASSLQQLRTVSAQDAFLFLRIFSPPTDTEIAALEAVDPTRLRELEFKHLRAAANQRRAHA